MVMQLLRNMLIEWIDPLSEEININPPKHPAVERVIAVFPAFGEVVVINIVDSRAFLKVRPMSELNTAYESGYLKILEKDPFDDLIKLEEDIPLKYRQIRDKAYEEIKPLIELEEAGEFFYYRKRGKHIRAFSIKTGMSKPTLYKRFRRWWQSGRRKNAFLPLFGNCGAPGKHRLLDSSGKSNPSQKLGRKTATQKAKEEAGESAGIRMTAQIYANFQKGLNKYYKKTEPRSLKDTFDLIIIDYFKAGYKIENNIVVPILLPQEQRPTFKQFRHWYDTHINKQHISRARLGEREYNLTGREILGDSTSMASAPGELYQIDSTIGDIYLVSALDRTRIIGRPVVYVCIDVFSHAITGVFVLLEGPSWLGAMLALDHVVADKVSYCAEYGIPIEESDWPCKGLPSGVLADRGEFIGYNADTLVNAFDMAVHNTASWRADWKGIVERQFGICNEKAIKFTPGYVPKRFPRRGDRDYSLDAVLTINEFRKLLISHVVDYNSHHYLKTYRKSPAMIADKLSPYPIDIWNWGIQNQGGRLLSIPQDKVRLSLMPRKRVSVTPLGIHSFGNLHYTCDRALREGWFSRARIHRSWQVEIAFDPRTTKRIYLILNGGTSMEVCKLTKASQHLGDLDWHDATDYFALENEALRKEETRLIQSSAKLDAIKKAIVEEATEKTRAAHAGVGPQSKRSRKKGINKNRALERQHERDKNIWVLDQTSGNGQSSPNDNPSLAANNNKLSETEYVPPTSKASHIRQTRDKRWRVKK